MNYKYTDWRGTRLHRRRAQPGGRTRLLARGRVAKVEIRSFYKDDLMINRDDKRDKKKWRSQTVYLCYMVDLLAPFAFSLLLSSVKRKRGRMNRARNSVKKSKPIRYATTDITPIIRYTRLIWSDQSSLESVTAAVTFASVKPLDAMNGIGSRKQGIRNSSIC